MLVESLPTLLPAVAWKVENVFKESSDLRRFLDTFLITEKSKGKIVKQKETVL